MYHAAANTILANTLMRSLSFVDEDKVGIMGVSWGGVITSTAIGIDDRFAFAIPVYGCGHKFTSSNSYSNRLGNNQKYIQVWDPFLRIQRAPTPTLWLSWPQDAHFPLDSQAYTYKRQNGEHTVSIVNNMTHSNAAAQARPEPIDYADSVVSEGSPWCVQKSLTVSGNTATVVFSSRKRLRTASLLWTADFDITTTNNSSNAAWRETAINAPINNGDGTYTVTATLPASTTAFVLNARARGSDGRQLIVSSDYEEFFDLTLSPSAGLSLPFPENGNAVTDSIEVSMNGPSNLPVVAINFINESHPGAFSTNTAPFLISEISPATTSINVSFNRAAANLNPEESASADIELVCELTDGSTESVTLPVRVGGNFSGGNFSNGTSINATSFSAESNPNQNNIIRNVNGAVGYTLNESWIRFDDFSFPERRRYNLTVSASAGGVGGVIELREGSPDGRLHTTIEVPNTGGFDNFQTFTGRTLRISSERDLYFVFKGGNRFLLDLKSFRID